MQDLWPDSVSQSGLVGDRLRDGVDAVLNRFCSWTYRRAAGIGVISPSMRHILVRRGVPDEKIHDTPNWVSPPDRVASGSGPGREELGLPRGRLFLYAGNLGEMQGLEPLVRAFTQAPDAQLVVLGDGVARQRLQSMAEAAGATNIGFRGHVPSDQVGAFIRASDVQIISLQDTPLLRATMPSKTQSALAHAKPVLAHAAGDVATLVRENHVGVVAPPGDLDATLAAIRALVSADEEKLSQMGASAGRLFDERFSPDVGLDRIEAMLATASGHGRTK
jgi:glycosyltransferase involved in cell wall biosynthesis